MPHKKQQKTIPLTKPSVSFVKETSNDESFSSTQTFMNRNNLEEEECIQDRASFYQPNYLNRKTGLGWNTSDNKNDDVVPNKTPIERISWTSEDEEPRCSKSNKNVSLNNGDQVRDDAYQRKLDELSVKVRMRKQPKDPLDLLFIVSRSNGTSALDLLHLSAAFSEVFFSADVDPVAVTCSLTVGYDVIAVEKGATVKLAKQAAAETALKYLISRCWTLKVNRIYHNDDEKITMNELECMNVKESKISSGKTENITVDTSLNESNKGMQLLKLMGWSGGGLGKEGEGIVEPIRPSNIFGRSGLGSQDYTNAVKINKPVKKKELEKKQERQIFGTDKSKETSYVPSNTIDEHKLTSEFVGGQIDDKYFKICAYQLLKQFSHDYDMEDMAFTPEFTNEQRKLVHQLGRKFRVKTKSYGKYPNRFLVVSKKRTWKELVTYLIENGGKTEKYELFPPGDSPITSWFTL